jgi:hypothetical protein
MTTRKGGSCAKKSEGAVRDKTHTCSSVNSAKTNCPPSGTLPCAQPHAPTRPPCLGPTGIPSHLFISELYEGELSPPRHLSVEDWWAEGGVESVAGGDQVGEELLGGKVGVRKG